MIKVYFLKKEQDVDETQYICYYVKDNSCTIFRFDTNSLTWCLSAVQPNDMLIARISWKELVGKGWVYYTNELNRKPITKILTNIFKTGRQQTVAELLEGV